VTNLNALSRHLRMARMNPRCFGIFALAKVSRLIGGRVEKVIPEESRQRKESVHYARGNVGHAIGKRHYVLKLAGRGLARFEVDEAEANVLNFYYLRDPDPVGDLVQRLARKGRLSPTSDWVVFEPGCNLGRMLFHLRDRYGARVVGADVYGEAIRAANRLATGPKEQFFESDLLESDFLSSRPDACFDLTVISSHLVHVMDKPRFGEYLAQLKRVSKRIVVHERRARGLEEALHVALPGHERLDEDPIAIFWESRGR
jgi:SAM-dependent methyltransferase